MPGTRLPAERELAAELGANRSSVREALRKVEQLGLVTIRHGGGATVQPLEHASLEVVRHLLFLGGRVDRPVLEQLLEVHELLICGATRLAVEHASEDDLDEARVLLASLLDPALETPLVETLDALLDLIARASRNLVLRIARRNVNPLLELRFRAARERMRPPRALLEPLVDAVTRALDARDADAAEQAVRGFLRLRRKHAIDALEALHPSDPEPEPPRSRTS